jgi:hypothetical protein
MNDNRDKESENEATLEKHRHLDDSEADDLDFGSWAVWLLDVAKQDDRWNSLLIINDFSKLLGLDLTKYSGDLIPMSAQIKITVGSLKQIELHLRPWTLNHDKLLFISRKRCSP